VALAERLLKFPGSPLWAADANALAEELARIRYLLVAALSDPGVGDPGTPLHGVRPGDR
jgi:hypothetical protein